jgi:AraC family transcriptional regulator, transcriptional activator of pobA
MPAQSYIHNACFSVQRIAQATALPAEMIHRGVVEMYVVFNGEVVVTTRKSTEILSAHSLYCLSAEAYTRVDGIDEVDGYLFRFNEAMIYSGDSELAGLYIPAFKILTLQKQPVHFQDCGSQVIRNMCEIMLQEFESKREFKSFALRSYISVFLFNLMRELKLLDCRSDEKSLVLIRNFAVLLEQHFRDKRKVSDYATLLAVTPNYLNATIKQATGTCAGIHIRRRVITEAVRKVKLTGLSMKEVAYDLGFKDNSHFSKFFKKASGEKFSELKKLRSNRSMVA